MVLVEDVLLFGFKLVGQLYLIMIQEAEACSAFLKLLGQNMKKVFSFLCNNCITKIKVRCRPVYSKSSV